MKNLIKAITLLSMLSLLSCSNLIYTSEQVMSEFKTKEGIIKKFGMPDEKRTGEGREEWLYKYEVRKPDLGKPFAGRYHNANTLEVINFSGYKRYIIFNIDSQGNVVGWTSGGLDLAKRKFNPGITALWSILGALFIAAATTRVPVW